MNSRIISTHRAKRSSSKSIKRNLRSKKLGVEALEQRAMLSIGPTISAFAIESPVNGTMAIQTLGPRLVEIAQQNNLAPVALVDHFEHDSTLYLDKTGGLFYADIAPPSKDLNSPVAAGATADTPPYPLADTFKLHSRPGCTKIVFLDFDGHVTPTGSGWNDGVEIDSTPFDLDGDATIFNSEERTEIQFIWQRVVEDYAPFDVDITTETPSDDAINRSDLSDQTYGMRCVISPTSDWAPDGAAGIAFLTSFSDVGETYKPCFVFSDKMYNDEKYITEGISHEVGHTLGLSHDGDSTQGYYPGHGSGETGWSAIMGVGYYENVAQWSKGEYYDSNNQEDDLDIITTDNGFGYRPDDHGDTIATASPLAAEGAQGVIEKNTDIDMFSFSTPPGTLTFDIEPYTRAPNLDILAKIYDSSGNVIQTYNSSSMLAASFSIDLPAGDYYLSVDGTGWGAPLSNPPTGYTEYGSLGQYWIQWTTPVQPIDLTVNKSHVGDFHPGDSGDTYKISIGNIGFKNSSGLVTVADLLPTGLTATAISGDGWITDLATLTAHRSDSLAPGSSYPDLIVTVNVAFNAPALVTNTATVSGGGDTNDTNNSDSDPTNIHALSIDLTIKKEHLGNFHPGDIGDTYRIKITNNGTDGTIGIVSVTDVLPEGLTATAISGDGWYSDLETLTAHRVDSLAPGHSYPDLIVTVNVASDAPELVTNEAVVYGGMDLNDSNNTAYDPTIIRMFTVTATTPSLTSGMANTGTATIVVDFSNALDDEFAKLASSYQLQNAGADGILGNSDDLVFPINHVVFNPLDDNDSVTLTVPLLLENVYRLTVKDAIQDIAMSSLDGNRDGIHGGDWIADFVITPSGNAVSDPTAFDSGGYLPMNIAAADFNGDGNTDLAVANGPVNGQLPSIGILLGDGDSDHDGYYGFTTSSIPSTTGLNIPTAVAVGDFNGDGKMDIAVANNGNNTVGIYLGNGNGTFATGTAVQLQYVKNGKTVQDLQPISLAVDDFNGDGKKDIAVANYGTNSVGILKGAGNGTFVYSSLSLGATNLEPRALAIANLDTDTKPEILITCYTSNNLVVLKNNSTSTNITFGTPTSILTGGTGPRSLAVGDLDGDGKKDAVIGNFNSNNVSILFGNGADGFATPILKDTRGANPTGNAYVRGVAIVDFDRDGKMDIAATNSGCNNVGIIKGMGGRAFGDAALYGTNRAYGPYGIATGDFNRDGRADLVVADSNATYSDYPTSYVTVLFDYMGPQSFNLMTPNGYVFDLGIGSFGQGEFLQGGKYVGGVAVPNMSNAFDGYGRFYVGGTLYQPAAQPNPATTADSGQTLVTVAQTIAGLTVNSKITVPKTGTEDFARTLDIFTNSSTSSISTAVTVVGNLGSDAKTQILATSSGDNVLTVGDHWFVTGGGTSPVLLHYIYGASGLAPTSLKMEGDNVEWTYNLTVPANQTRELGYFTVQAADLATAISEGAALVGASGLSTAAKLGMTTTDLNQLVNFSYTAQPMTITASDWANASSEGLLLKFNPADQMVHIYDKSTMADVVAARNLAFITNIGITGRNDAKDVLTVDFGGGNMIPTGGLNFNGGTGVGNTLLLAGTSGNDTATLTAAQFLLNGFQPVVYSNVEAFGFSSASGTDNLTLDHVVVNCDRDNAISSNTSVLVKGGSLNFNGHAVSVANLGVTNGGQINAGSVIGGTVAVESGTLTAASIVADSLFIGSLPPAPIVSDAPVEEIPTVPTAVVADAEEDSAEPLPVSVSPAIAIDDSPSIAVDEESDAAESAWIVAEPATFDIPVVSHYENVGSDALAVIASSMIDVALSSSDVVIQPLSFASSSAVEPVFKEELHIAATSAALIDFSSHEKIVAIDTKDLASLEQTQVLARKAIFTEKESWDVMSRQNTWRRITASHATASSGRLHDAALVDLDSLSNG